MLNRTLSSAQVCLAACKQFSSRLQFISKSIQWTANLLSISMPLQAL